MRKGSVFFLVSGKPLEEPVAWYGPIVMNTQEQLRQAFDELDKGTFLKTEARVSGRPRGSSLPAKSPFTRRRTRNRSTRSRDPRPRTSRSTYWLPLLISVAILIPLGWWFHSRYTVSFQSPIRVRLVSPLVIEERLTSPGASEARADQQGRRLSAWQDMPAGSWAPIAVWRLLSSAPKTRKASARSITTTPTEPWTGAISKSTLFTSNARA